MSKLIKPNTVTYCLRGVLLAKPQKEKSVTKDKLIGMKVIDADGNLVGTVKDVGFTVGKPGISLSVEGEDGKISDIVWESIQGAGDFVILKPAAQAATVVQPAQPAQPVQAAQPMCPTCGRPLTYIKEYQRWYCYNDKKYV
jgi:sporulation protein YlmC with PRC-barrel domain